MRLSTLNEEGHEAQHALLHWVERVDLRTHTLFLVAFVEYDTHVRVFVLAQKRADAIHDAPATGHPHRHIIVVGVCAALEVGEHEAEML